MTDIAHPDTIPGLDADCRRVLRAEYDQITVTSSALVRARLRQPVVTYALAYSYGQVDLCAEHARDAATQDATGALGQVQHGEHRGVCAECVRRASGALRAARAEYCRVAGMWGVEVGS